MLRAYVGCLCLIGFLGCTTGAVRLTSPVRPEVRDKPASPPEKTATAAAAKEYWQRGQDAMNGGHPDEAIDYYQMSLAADPKLDLNHLSLAAARMELQD